MRVMMLLILLVVGVASVLSLIELWRIRCNIYGVDNLIGRVDSVEGDIEILMKTNQERGKAGRKDYFEIIKLKRDNARLKTEIERLKKEAVKRDTLN